MLNALVLIGILLLAQPNIDNIREQDFELHPSLGVVITIDGYKIAYPVYGSRPVMHCGQVVNTVDFNIVLCYNLTEIILGEPTMFRRLDCEYCMWQSMDEWKEK